MKNFRTIHAALLMLCCATLSAHNFEVEGIFYNILSEGDRTVEVTYKGSSFHEYSGEYSGNVVIPANVTYEGTTYSVTTIGVDAFYGCDGITSITIPNSVTTIGNDAFDHCSGLTSVTIGNSVTTIGDYAFYDCDGITSITIPNSVTTIGNNAFCDCDGLTSIVVAEDNTIYDSREDCNAIIETEANTLIQGCKNTIIPNSVTTIGNSAFHYCTGLTSIEIPNSVTTIGESAFYHCDGLTSIEIPNSVTTIGQWAFSNCYDLTSIEIPNSVTTIENRAFEYCKNLTSITIGNSVTTIGNSAFEYCYGLTSIVVAEDNTIYDSREDCNAIIETATNTLIQGCKNTIIPNSVTTIGDYAFYDCYRLTSIEIPNSVTTIGYSAFQYCTGLTSIEIPNSVTTIGDRAFSGCHGLTSIEIPNSVTTIGYYAFYNCEGLTSIEIPNSVTTIGDYAFFGCEGLTSVTSLISANELFSIGNNVFIGVNKNACTLYVPYGAKETYAATDGWNEFTNIVEIKYYDLTVSAAGYATLYLDFNAEIPEGVEVYTASNIDGNRLMMQQVTGILPANTGVIVRAEQGTYTFVESCEAAEAIESNLLRGSVEDVYITPSKDAKYYVLAMKDGVVGMYEDALTGGTFKNNAHKAYLVLGEKNLGIYDEEVDTENPGMQLSNSYYFDFSSTTAIEPVINEVEDAVYYDLSGRRVENPVQGIYIVNGKKVLVK